MPQIDLGFCWPLVDACTPEKGVPLLRAAGFDGIELWPQTIEQFGIERWARALRAEGMRCLQLCPYFNFVAGPAAVEESRRMLTRFLAAAAVLDCRRLRVFTGPPWGDGVVGAQSATDAQWQAAIDGLREFCNIAAQANVELCLECHEGSLMENSVSTLRLLHAVEHPNLTVNLQLPLLDEAWQTSVEQLGSYTTHIHIHNWTEGLGLGEQTSLADGVFDWMPALKILVHHFQRPFCLSIEHADHGGRDNPWETAAREGETLRHWKKLLLTADL